MPTYAIGDVQGCYSELKELLDLIDFKRERDRLWFVGDLVNRGPESLETLRFVRSLGAAATTVLGNHDLHLLAVAFGSKERQRDRLREGDTIEDVLKARDCDELLHWLRTQPLFHYDAQLGCALLHAGLPPQWDIKVAERCAHEVETALKDNASMQALFDGMYGNQPDQWSDKLKGLDRLRFIVNCFTRLRACDREGRLALKYKGTLQNLPVGLYPWFRAPQRRSETTTLVCGHWSAIDYYDSRNTDENVLAIDTGCVWGNRLCAVRLDKISEPNFVASKQPRRSGD